MLSLFSIKYSVNKSAVISETMRFIEYIALFTVFYLFIEKEEGVIGLKIFNLSMILVAIYGIIQFIFNKSEFMDSISILNRGRIYSTFVNPNYYGAAINIIIFYYIIKFVEESRNRVLNILIFSLFFVNLILTLTRGSWFGFIVGIIIISILRYRKLLYSIPAGLGLIAFIPNLRTRFISSFDFTNLTNSERIILWKTGYLMFKDHVLTGVGNGNYLYRYAEYIKKYPELNLGRNMFSVHNSYIKMFAELGIFGGIIFIVIYLLLFYLVYTIYKNSKIEELKQISLAFLGFWGAYLFQNFFNNLMFIPQLNVLVWVITAIIYKLYIIERREANDK